MHDDTTDVRYIENPLSNINRLYGLLLVYLVLFWYLQARKSYLKTMHLYNFTLLSIAKDPRYCDYQAD